MNLSTEIRKLSPGDAYMLIQILEYDESWKKLMAVIPKTLNLDTFECKIAINNLTKYNTEHFKLIEAAGFQQRRPCAEILLEEWGTSGRIRPRLGHLIYLLMKTELYRAADYIAGKLLNMSALSRPLTGPAAKVNTSYSQEIMNGNQRIELSNINYPSSLLNVGEISSFIIDELTNRPTQRLIPTIIVNGSDRDNNVVETNTISNNLSVGVMEHTEISNESPLHESRSTNMVFSSDNQIPALSDLLDAKQCGDIKSQVTPIVDNYIPNFSNILSNSSSENNIPAFSQILCSAENKVSTTSSSEIPHFTELLQNNNDSTSGAESLELPHFTDLINPSISLTDQNNSPTFQDNSAELPRFSGLLQQCTSPVLQQHPSKTSSFSSVAQSNSESKLPLLSLLNMTPTQAIRNSSQTNFATPNVQNSSQISLSSPVFPNLITFQAPSMEIPLLSDLLNVSPVPSICQQSSRTTCASPLPNLYLNTVLPHYTYQELEQCTENFDETILSSLDSATYDPVTSTGRKLGSGAFGSVYLATGLLEKPVAVKKLNLSDVNVVNVDDTITKQFRNEVELLCKYKHDNLLSLLGYSCDGPTYCLIYEYICGGALKDRLQWNLKSSDQYRLLWTDRLYIALGTAKAVSYLHNAYSMPLIHRDIKSANILLDNANKPKLCDFGLIKLTPNQNTNTSTTIFGTSAYMAPEAFRGDVSVKLDTFSFGVVLLELLTSLPPLDENREGNDLVTHIEEVCESDITPLLDTNAGSWTVQGSNFGEQLFTIASQCLEEKKRRPVMSQVVAQLTEIIHKTSESDLL